MIIKTVVVGMAEANCYIVACEKTKEAVIIDPGADAREIKMAVAEAGVNPKCIINTHGHADHTGANKDFNLPVIIHSKDADFLADPKKNLSFMFGLHIISPAAGRLVEEGDIIQAGEVKLEVIHTPGHTPGGICLMSGKIIFTGDTLFCDGIGRSDFPYSDEKALVEAIRNKLLTLPEDTLVYPGHGPTSTIGRERLSLLGG